MFAVSSIQIPNWHWGLLIGWFLFLIVFDLLVLHRSDHEPNLRQAMVESFVWIGLGIGLGAIFWFAYGGIGGQQYFSGYLIEKSLSIDNVFAWSVILGYFAIPPKYQYRVLFWGIFGALVMRAIFIFGGIALIQQFEAVLVLFAAVLLYTGIKLLITKEKYEFDPGSSRMFSWLKRHVRVSHQLDGHNFFTIENGKRVATMLFLALLVIEATDVVFAVDSVPAILAVSRDPFIVFASNAAAILGLRSLYFVFAKVKDKFWLLNKALGILMIAIALKMVLTSHELLGIKWFGIEVSTTISLLTISVVLIGGIVSSLIFKNPGEAKT